ncbi:hypothetical protein SEA_GUEY18_73 [Gordonia phage Guey18]|nr:hypothetical protein SEA_GUEY18_73 [Gordonia phage Guey18]
MYDLGTIKRLNDQAAERELQNRERTPAETYALARKYRDEGDHGIADALETLATKRAGQSPDAA